MTADRLIEGSSDASATPIFCVREGATPAGGAPEGLVRLARANNFSGEAGVVLVGDEGALLGVGDGSDPFIAAAAADRLPEGLYRFADALDARGARAAALGWLLGGYRFDRYKKLKAPHARLLAPDNVEIASVKREADAVFLVRDLVNTPAADMTPADLERVVRAVGEEFGAEVSAVIGGDLVSGDLSMIHAVGRAAAIAPRLIDLKWGRADAPKVTLVGKGVTFDSGGLDIKNAEGMRLMKKDMGGAANALGLARLIMGAGLDVRLRVLIPAVENAISAGAFRPGDILKSRKGLTVEIGNTDAEGRLVLADAIALGAEEEPTCLITLATLTGAARVALGPDLPPFYCADEEFAAEVAAASAEVADPVWRMPLWPGYEHMLSSLVADLNNSPSGSFAGSVTAALFLKRFAHGAAVFAHFDIYAWRPRALPGRPIGGESQAMRALFATLARRFGGKA